MCSFAFNRYMLQEPGSFGKAGNRAIKRIVVHHTGVKQSAIPDHAKSAWNWWSAKAKEGKKVSAHFVIEPDGSINQMIDTDDIGYGTACFCANAVHIEHAGSGEPFTNSQLHASAMLIAWVKSFSPELNTTPVGTGPTAFGDRSQLGITCHSWSDQAAIAFNEPYAPGSAKTTCPGGPMMDAIPTLATLAANYKNAVPTLTSPAIVTAASFFHWTGASPESV